MAKRQQNERRFPTWETLPSGGRRYFRIVKGRHTGYARYVKIVDAEENTIAIIQEIYDSETGHQLVVSEDSE